MDLSKLIANPTVQQANTELTSFTKGRKNPTDYYNEAINSLGVPDARAKVQADRQAITDTQNLVDAVEPSVTGRTSGSLVTEAQRQGLINKETAPLMAGLGKLQGAYGTSSANLADLMGQAQTQASLGYAGQQDTYAALIARLEDARYREEQERIKAAAAAANSAWSGFGSGGGDLGGGGQSGGYGRQQRADKGFNFVDQYGNPISAATYAINTNTPFRQLLQSMANAGDKGAAEALQFVGDDYGFDPRKMNSGRGNVYNQLVWGSPFSYGGGTGSFGQKSAMPSQAALDQRRRNELTALAGY